MNTFKIYTLGCKVNAYESEGYAFKLKELGYKESEGIADIYIINTCSVTNTAASKSRQKIHKAKKENPNATICIVGCFVQTDEKINELNADVIIGSSDKKALPMLVDKAFKEKCVINDLKPIDDCLFEAIEIDKFEHKTRAFIKIQDGCNQFCSYCIIPYARGRQRSSELNDVIRQAKKLVLNGHKEIVLTGIHTGRYLDANGHDLLDVLKELVKIDGLERIRLSSIEINEISDEMINFMQNNRKIANHLHIPVQSCCNKVLKDMNRPYTIEEFINRVKYIRLKLDRISISTDIILGFPDESEEDVNETIKNLKLINFSFMHIFPYSKRSGTKAELIKNHLPNSIKKERCKIVNQISKEGYENYKKSLLNTKLVVLFEYYEDGYNYGHASEYVLVKVKGEKSNNQLVNVIAKDIVNDVIIGEME